VSLEVREPIPDLPGVVDVAHLVDPAGRAVVLHSQDLQRSLSALLEWAASRQIELTGLDARHASLEEAFLAVAGSTDPAESTDHQELTA
jgi:ABC-2 type transport system ATP-binding protein